ncbi:MAG: helix-hairpin-helix domain-containing protein [Promethearchaeota archaeon]
MEKKLALIAIVKSPAKNAYLRRGNGFSLKEIEEAGKTIEILKRMDIKIDYFRKSSHPENIKQLKALEIPKIEKKKKKPYIKKEKKRTPFKPIEERVKRKPKKVVKEKPKVTPTKPKPKVIKKEKVKPVKLEKIPVKAEGIPLTELPGLGAATAKKFIELGVNTVEDLCKESPEELSTLIKGVSLDRMKKWIEEGKELLK